MLPSVCIQVQLSISMSPCITLGWRTRPYLQGEAQLKRSCSCGCPATSGISHLAQSSCVPQHLFRGGLYCQRHLSWTCLLNFKPMYFYTTHEYQRWQVGGYFFPLQLQSSRWHSWAIHLTNQCFNCTDPHKASQSTPTNHCLNPLTLIHPFRKIHFKKTK